MSFWRHLRRKRYRSSSSEWKTRALNDFREWLATQPDEPDPETTEDIDEEPDLLTLLGELTAIRQEVRGMGRTSARLSGSIEDSGMALREKIETITQKLDTEAKERIKRESMRPLLLELADMADVLHEVSERTQEWDWPVYVPGFIRHRVEASVADPISVLQLKAEALLRRYNLQPLVKIGDTFDASIMNAVSVSNESTVDENCVSAIVRQAYKLGQDVLRMAEVIIEEKTP